MNGRKMRQLARTITLGVLALGVVALVSGAGDAQAKSRLDEIKDRGVLRAAGVVYRPLMIRHPDGTYDGVDIEIMHKYADALGVKLKIVDAGWDTAVAGITTGKWDIVPTICITKKRQKVVDFTQPYLQLGGAIVVRADSGLKTLQDVNKPNIQFADVAGGWGEEYAKKAAPKARHKEFGQATDADMIQEILSGRADAAVMNEPVTTALIKQQYGDKLSFIPAWNKPLGIQPCPVAYALPKGDKKFADFLNGELSKLKKTGQLQALFDKWLKPEYIKGDK